jgi:hypothetical protein
VWDNFSWLILALGSLFFLCLYLAISWGLASGRSLVYSPDENIFFASQGSRLSSYFFGSPAIEDFREQASIPTDDNRMSYVRLALAHHEVILQYHVPAWFMAASHYLLGLEWEKTYHVFEAAVRFLQVGAIAYFLSILWGRASAGLALVLIALTLFPSYGVFWVAPSNVSQMFALIVWAYILSQGRQASTVLITGVIILLLTHPLGRLYALIAWGLYLFPFGKPQSQREWRAIVLSPLLVALYWILPNFIQNPILAYNDRVALPEGMSLLRATALNVQYSFEYVQAWYLAYPFQLLGALFVLAFASLTLERERQLRLAWISLFLGILLLASSVHTLAVCCWAESFRRNFMLAQFIFYGGTAWAFFKALAYLIEYLPKVWRSPSLVRISLLLTPLLILYTSTHYMTFRAINGAQKVRQHYHSFMVRQAYLFQPETVNQLLANLSREEAVLYMEMVSRQYLMLKGLRDYNGVFYPAIDDGEHEKDYLRDESLRWLVDLNPIERFDHYYVQEGRVLFHKLPYLRYESPLPAPLNTLEFYLDNPAETFMLEIQLPTGQTFRQNVPADYIGWWRLDALPALEVSQFELSFQDAPPQAAFRGLRFSHNESERFWPWAQRATLTTYSTTRQREDSAIFDEQTLYPFAPFNKQAHIFRDADSMLLGTLTPIDTSREARSE